MLSLLTTHYRHLTVFSSTSLYIDSVDLVVTTKSSKISRVITRQMHDVTAMSEVSCHYQVDLYLSCNVTTWSSPIFVITMLSLISYS